MRKISIKFAIYLRTTITHLGSSPAAKLQEVLRVPPKEEEEEEEEGREDLTFSSSY